MRGRHAECAYLVDRAIKNPASTEEFADAALDALRLALRPAYAAIICRGGQTIFHCGDSALNADLDAAADAFAHAARSVLSRPCTISRSDAATCGVPSLERVMTAAALELVLPLADSGELLGVVAIGPRLDRTPYSAEDLEMLNRVGARLAMVAAREALALEVATLRTAAAGSERLASVGRMAAGLAHEIRNPLVSIRTFTQLLPERHADEEFRNGFLDLTLAEIDRICTLVGEILSYARPADAMQNDSDIPTTDVAETIGRTCQLLRSHARSAGVALDFDSEEIADRAAIDEDKLRQVVINLVVNGIQASAGHGRVRVSARPKLGGTCALDRIVVDVHDDGLGMTADVASRIFEPFFTTRREGTGLGLALVKTILDEAGATITVETAPGRGTTFHIELLPERLAALRSTRESRHKADAAHEEDIAKAIEELRAAERVA